MKYVGIYTQQRRNNFRSVLLLLLFPCLVVALVFLFSFLSNYYFFQYQSQDSYQPWHQTVLSAKQLIPFVMGGVLVWFIFAYFTHTRIINSATGAHPLSRKENKRVYNLVENLCMSQGLKMPQINVIEDDSLNAYASGINERSYTVALSRGIIDKLDDSELEAVIAHELSHIRNRDVRLLIISIVFVGIFAMIAEIALRIIRTSSFRSNKDNKGGVVFLLFVAFLVALIGYFFSSLMRFAISRKREYLADAGSAEMTKNPIALASALRKISDDPDIEAVRRDDVAQLFIEHPRKKRKTFFSALSDLFATHPPIEKRIKILEQF